MGSRKGGLNRPSRAGSCPGPTLEIQARRTAGFGHFCWFVAGTGEQTCQSTAERPL